MLTNLDLLLEYLLYLQEYIKCKNLLVFKGEKDSIFSNIESRVGSPKYLKTK